MAVEQNKEIARRFIQEIINTGDWSNAGEIVSQDVTMDHPSSPELVRGLEAVSGMLGAFKAGFSDLQLTIEDMVAEGDKVAVQWRARGTHDGNLFGIPPTGKSMNAGGMSLFTIQDGKIVHDVVREDSLGVMQQLGVIPS
jgi:steroid delta-isomerase-like uncharacterized protein